MKKRYPFGTITITRRSRELIKDILDSGRVSVGKYVREFEKRFAGLIGTRHAVACSSGTDALALSYAVLYEYGAKRNDEIIVPALSFVATGNAVLQAGFIPRFVEIKRETLNIDVDRIEAAVNRKTRAIAPVHLMGKPADMGRIRAIAKKHGLSVIEDAAEAQGAVYRKKNVGTMGDMAAFSLYVAHVISTVEGGIVTTNNPKYARILRSLRAHGRACKCDVCVMNTRSKYCPNRFMYGEDVRFIFERIGFSAKMNELEAAIGLGYMGEYKKILKVRKRNFSYIREKFNIFSPDLVTIRQESYERMAPYAFPVLVSKEAGFTKNELVQYLEKNGIDTRSMFQSMPTQCPGFAFLGYKTGDFPEAEYVSNNGFHIGIHQDIKKDQIDYFIGLVKDFLSGKRGK